MNSPIVSIIMPTYNHEAYITESIKSVLMQKTEYSYELLINDDCSTDNTRNIAKEYAKNFPDIIKLIYPETNQGLLKSYKRLMEIAKGKYIAILESDDIWTDKFKLQKQISFLENNEDYSLVVGNYMRINHAGEIIEPKFINMRENLNGYWYEELLCENPIGAVTICFRKNTFDKYCSIDDYISKKFITFDYPLLLSLAANSKCFCINEILAHYRVLETSISNTAVYEKSIAFEDSVCEIQDYIIQKFGKRNLDEYRYNECRVKKYIEKTLKFNKIFDFIKYARKLHSHEFKYKMMHYFPLLWYLQHKIRVK